MATLTATEYKDKIIAYLKNGGDADAFLNRLPEGKSKTFAQGVIASYQDPKIQKMLEEA